MGEEDWIIFFADAKVEFEKILDQRWCSFHKYSYYVSESVLAIDICTES